MPVSLQVDNLVPNVRHARRKKSEIRRHYKSNLELIDDGKVEIVPHQDERLSYLRTRLQDRIVELNCLIKREGEHIEDDVYRIEGEEAINVIKEEIEDIVVLLELETEPLLEMFVLLIIGSVLLILMAGLLQTGSPYETLFGIIYG